MIHYGKYCFPDMVSFYHFLLLKDVENKLTSGLKEIFQVLNSPDLKDFDKAVTLSRCCRLTPEVQKMSACPSHSISKECLDRIFSLAMGLQANKARELQAEKIRNNRFMKNRLKK